LRQAARIAHQDDLIALMAPVLGRRPRAIGARHSKSAACPTRRLHSSEALEDRRQKHLGIEVEAQHPTMGRFRTVRFP